MREKSFENIKNACEKALKERYIGGVPDRVRERIDKELGYLKNSQSIEDFEIMRMLFEGAKKSSNLIFVKGVEAGSFIYYLMSDSKVNPLPAHFYCPKCGHYEEVGRGIFGIDLPKEKCSECGETMISDGIDIPIMSVWNKKANLSFEYDVSSDFLSYAKQLLEDMYPNNDIETCVIDMQYRNDNEFTRVGFYILPEGKTIEDYTDYITYLDDGTKCMTLSEIESEEENMKKILLIPNSYLDCVLYMQNKTGINYDEISLDDIRNIKNEDIHNMRLMDEEFSNLLDKNKPESVKMISNLYGAAHNTYDMNMDERKESFLQSEVFERCPLYVREDIYDYLIECGPDKEVAYSYMEMVRRGLLYSYINSEKGWIMKRFKDVIDIKVPEELYESASKCRYLFPRVCTVGYTYLYMMLAYYMKKDSKAYSDFIKKMKDKIL